MSSNALLTFKKWYNLVVLVIIVAFFVAAYMHFGTPSAYLYGCFAVLAGFMLVVTNLIIKFLLPKEKNNKFRNHK